MDQAKLLRLGVVGGMMRLMPGSFLSVEQSRLEGWEWRVVRESLDRTRFKGEDERW